MIPYAIYFLAVISSTAGAQDKYWIYFSDKGVQQRAFAPKSYSTEGAALSLGIEPRTLSRRAKIFDAPSVDALDLPVAVEYLAALRAQGIAPGTESRWLNAVSARLTADQRSSLQDLPFVARIERVRVYHTDSLTAGVQQSQALQKILAPYASRLDYGASYDQVQQINVPRLHDLNITGRGVIVGMLDAGYRWRTHEALRNTNVLAEYDFIQNDSVTSNQTGDGSTQDQHGTMTLSTLAGYMPGQLIGPAFGAAFLLGKTEYVPAELNIEEDHWVAGIEWLERSGADVVSTSLGYSEFDPGQHSYTYQDMNGHTAVTTKAAVIAARKGVLLCVAMGNEGALPWHFLTSPADADSIIAVGAVSGTGVVTSFSSVGPTSDGRTKPDVCARGLNDVVATPVTNGASTYVSVNGTSVSTPLVAGAAALLLSARPELTPMQVRDALRNTASNTALPDNSIGWGIIDAYKALLYNGLLISASLVVSTGADSARTIGATIIASAPLVTGSLQYHYSVDGAASFVSGVLQLSAQIDTATHSGTYSFVLPKKATQFYITAQDEHGVVRSLPYNAPAMVYDSFVKAVASPKLKDSVPSAAIPLNFALDQNFPNPFNGRTTIRFALAHAGRVSLTVYDILGRVAAVLANEEKDPGSYTVSWNASAVSSGIYFYALRTAEFSMIKKMVLLK